MKTLAQLPNLRSLDVSMCPTMTEDIALAVARMDRLEELRISGERVGIRGARAIMNLPRLQSLSIGKLC